MSLYYVYELIDPRSSNVFYVGKGKGNRIDAHEIEARSGRISRKCDMIREIEAEGLFVRKREAKSFNDEQEAYDFEAELVDKYGLENLTNMIPGGGAPRNGRTLYLDRIHVRCAAEIINRTINGKISKISVDGQEMDLLPIIALYSDRAIEVVRRRGLDWANAIATRYGVEFTGAII